MAANAFLAFSLHETWNIIVDCEDSNGNALDITGAQDANWRMSFRSGGLIFDLDLSNGITVQNAPAGQLAIQVTPTMQFDAGLQPGVYAYDCQVTLEDGTVTDQVAGQLTVRGSQF